MSAPVTAPPPASAPVPAPGADDVGVRMHGLVGELYPLCRSITGDGLRETLRRIRRQIPIEIHEVPTGTKALDWTVPREWNVRDAWVKNARGERVIDFRRSNLHVVSYSVAVHRRMSLAELKSHLHSLPEHPDWIPYRTSYYQESWGFCLPHRTLLALEDGDYEVCIDSTLEQGHLSYGEYYLPGERRDEILISCHACHPSLANDNLSGIAVAVELARALADRPRRYGVRFLFIPGTIGSLTWLARHESETRWIRHGLVLSCLGDRGGFTYKQSRRGDATVDRAAAHVLRHSGRPFRIDEFTPYGYDERQYCSPGFDLPVGRLSRTPNGEYPEYHTSADDLSLVAPASLAESLAACLAIIETLEHDAAYHNVNPRGEPQLGRRGLYGNLGGGELRGFELALLWVLNLSDGRHTLLDIAERAGIPFRTIRAAAEALGGAGLLRPVESPA